MTFVTFNSNGLYNLNGEGYVFVEMFAVLVFTGGMRKRERESVEENGVNSVHLTIIIHETIHESSMLYVSTDPIGEIHCFCIVLSRGGTCNT